jgi:hypothetical protein
MEVDVKGNAVATIAIADAIAIRRKRTDAERERERARVREGFVDKGRRASFSVFLFSLRK